MGSILIALLPLIQDAIGGEAIGAALSSLTITQWVAIAADLVNAEPQIIAAIKALNPAIEEFASAVRTGADRLLAAQDLHLRLQVYTPETIPGYAADGGVTSIPNPDLKQGE